VNISHEDRESVLASLEVRPGAQAVGAGLFDEALIQVNRGKAERGRREGERERERERESRIEKSENP